MSLFPSRRRALLLALTLVSLAALYRPAALHAQGTLGAPTPVPEKRRLTLEEARSIALASNKSLIRPA